MQERNPLDEARRPARFRAREGTKPALRRPPENGTAPQCAALTHLRRGRSGEESSRRFNRRAPAPRHGSTWGQSPSAPPARAATKAAREGCDRRRTGTVPRDPLR
jgi:hypothetical protein